jgi:hypothetical protein
VQLAANLVHVLAHVEGPEVLIRLQSPVSHRRSTDARVSFYKMRLYACEMTLLSRGMSSSRSFARSLVALVAVAWLCDALYSDQAGTFDWLVYRRSSRGEATPRARRYKQNVGRVQFASFAEDAKTVRQPAPGASRATRARSDTGTCISFPLGVS